MLMGHMTSCEGTNHNRKLFHPHASLTQKSNNKKQEVVMNHFTDLKFINIISYDMI